MVCSKCGANKPDVLFPSMTCRACTAAPAGLRAGKRNDGPGLKTTRKKPAKPQP